MDGVEAASKIGKLALPKMPRIIAVTADVSRSARERLAGAGIAKIVSKPILINALREAIEDDLEAEPADVQLTAGALIDRHFLDDQKELLGAAQIAKLHRLLEETSEKLIDDIAKAATTGDRMFTNVCTRFGPGGTMYRVKKVHDWTSGGLTLFCIDPATKWDLSPPGEQKEPRAEAADHCWWVRLDD